MPKHDGTTQRRLIRLDLASHPEMHHTSLDGALGVETIHEIKLGEALASELVDLFAVVVDLM